MSNRLTFSLASLILIFAFGFVFGTTSVMAHPDASGDDTTTPRPHDHPLEETLPQANTDADVTANRAGIEVTPHNAHPTVQSIVLKPGDTVRDNMVAVSAADTQTDDLDANEFILVITFDQDVVGGSINVANIPGNADAETNSVGMKIASLTITLER